MPTRTHFVTGALLATGLLAVFLVAESFRAFRGHQAITEQVLHAYAGLGAEAGVRLLESGIGGRVYSVLVRVRGLRARSPERLPSLVQGPGVEVARAVRWTAVIDSSTGGILEIDPATEAASWSPEAAARWRTADARLKEGTYLGVLRHGDDYVVFSPSHLGGPIVAYAMPVATMAHIAEQTLADAPILPAAVARGGEVGDGLTIQLRDDRGTLYTRGRTDQGRFTGSHQMGPMYADMVVDVSIAEALAPRLIIGGLPRSRVPLLMAVLAVTLLLAGSGAVLLHQERALSRLREDVITGASHELRTPLAQIRLFAETLRLGRVRNSEERDHAAVVIEREARRLEHMVDNLLHTARTERGGIRLALEPTDLTDLTALIVDDFKPLAAKAGVILEMSGERDAIASVDHGAWRQVVVNLLDNAVKYGGSESAVRVTVGVSPSTVTMSVEDQGPGIVAGDRERIWQRFRRGDVAVTAGVAGAGLGLATVRDLVVLHGGECRMEPAVPTGSRFIVELPR